MAMASGSTLGSANATSLVATAWVHAEDPASGTSSTFSPAALYQPISIAMKMGWYKAAGLNVELVPLAGSSACTQAVATREVAFALPSVEPLAIAIRQGVKAKIFYTAYQGNINGI